MESRSSLVLPSLILGAAIVLTGAVAAGTMLRVKALADVIAVTGSAEKIVQSDTAKWTVQLTRSAGLSDLPAGHEAVEKDLAMLREYLKEKKINPSWITVAPVMVETMYDYNRAGAPAGYTIRQSVTVEAADVAAVRAAAEGAGTLIGKGAVASTVALEYFSSQLAIVKQDILAMAMQDAQQRATKIAESVGGSLGRLRSAQMGVLQVTSKNSVEITDYGVYDTSAVEKKVTAVVRASFAVE